MAITTAKISKEGSAMLSITKYDNHFNYKTLENTPDMFHKALKNVLRGEKNFHVGTGNPGSFDLV